MRTLLLYIMVPPSGGSLEIGNDRLYQYWFPVSVEGSPFGGIPRNWKLKSLTSILSSDLGFPLRGIPRNWKPRCVVLDIGAQIVFPLRGDP